MAAHRILVLDDSRVVADIFAQLLREMGYEVSCLYNPREAVTAIREREPNVVFSDISMSGLSGYELATMLRKQEEFQKIVLIALTGYDQPEDAEKALAAGFDFHFTKPVGIDELKRLFNSMERPQGESQTA